eukprot:10864490-Heterocapsa_arctica.AAC.1
MEMMIYAGTTEGGQRLHRREKNDDRSDGAELGIMVEVQRDNSEDRTNAADTGFLINNQARKRAEEKQAE